MNTTPRTSPEISPASQGAEFARFCERRTGETFEGPGSFDRFSVRDFRRFWALFLEWADPECEGNPEPVCTDDRCEQAKFFPQLQLNYAENLLRSHSAADDERVAVVARHGAGEVERISRGELRRRVRTLAAHLRALGVEQGDRVAAIAGNNAEVMIAGLAAATIGATFSSAAPDMGAPAILARFEQLAPRVLLVNLGLDGGGASTPLAERVGTVAASLATLAAVIALDDAPAPDGVRVPVLRLSDLLAEAPERPLEDGWQRFPFNHPLFVLFTSGTTGPPKCIIHGAGGTLLEHLKEHRLHVDLRPEDTLFFHTTAAWMMWNWQLSALACGARVVVFDGALGGAETLWSLVAEEEVTVFGTSPLYLQLCEDSGYSPRRHTPAETLRTVLSTGSVLGDWQYDWVAAEVGSVRLQSISGGTDIIGCFVLGHPDLPVRRGRIQCRSLGLDVAALASEATPSSSEVGELVCRNPFPSRPLGFLGDDGTRFHDSYFAENEGVWTHGDLIEFDDEGQARIHGRSDGVLNIRGVRIGPSEIYQALREVEEVGEAMAVEQQASGGARLVLLVVLREGAELDGRLTLRIRRAIARHATPLHVPELVVSVEELPTTHSGKRSERAGCDAVDGREAANSRALVNPGSVARIRDAVARAEEMRGGGEVTEVADDAPTLERLRAIWEAVLEVEPLEARDNFFEVGGTSLLAVRLFYLIAERLGADLPLSTLLEAPTLGELAGVVDDPAKWVDPLMLLRPGEGEPIFFVHSIWGDVLALRPLALALASDVPVYGIRALGLNQDQEAQTTVEEMASTYIEVIRECQPSGPVRVGGYSFAGLVAFEIARQLAERGEEVEWVGLVDAELHPACLPPLRRWRYRAARPYHLTRSVLDHPRDSLRALFRDLIPNFLRRSVLRVFPAAPIAPPAALWMDGVPPTLRALAKICMDAATAYRPQPYPGRVYYFLPEQRRLHLFADPLPVWRRVAEGGLDVEQMAGGHLEMVSEANARFVAERIDAQLGVEPKRS